MTAKRYSVAVSPMWRPLLLPIGVTDERAFARIEEDELHVRFGLFDYHFPLEAVESATEARWPLWAGIGARTNFRGVVGLIGTYVNVVMVQFKEPQQVRMFLRVPCQRLYIAMEEPHAFIDALRRRLTPAAKAA